MDQDFSYGSNKMGPQKFVARAEQLHDAHKKKVRECTT